MIVKLAVHKHTTLWNMTRWTGELERRRIPVDSGLVGGVGPMSEPGHEPPSFGETRGMEKKRRHELLTATSDTNNAGITCMQLQKVEVSCD